MNLKYVIAIAMTFFIGMAFAQSAGGTYNAPSLPRPAFNQSNQSYVAQALPQPDSNLTYVNSTNSTNSNATYLPTILPRPIPDAALTNSTVAAQTALIQQWLYQSPFFFRLLGI